MKAYLLVLTTLAPSLCFAEVADKMPSYPSMWGLALALCMGFSLLARLWKGFLLLAILVSLFMAYGVYDAGSDPSFLSAVESEFGRYYQLNSYLSALIIGLVPILFSLRKRNYN
ncbi:hypothetical protein WH50_22935 [Pokkaliibacter plantistimulans]|uniref:Uncharacterized protein n=1 Tax=Pokkaliibacter plantistimulans TaxID=1635171 RepID=A0ABX5LUR8_9GAMM|nr:hypothetical protein [Pokkaliibacter plantistimulans]PXF29031.1 hypothetical protein WH50_22935 [Pokkaliibacter plantistimulans]